jgi:thiol:disulfide interchange protein DsbD
MKRIILFTLLITGILFAQNVVSAQDTASASGIEFTPINPPPAAKNETLNNEGSRGKTVDKRTTKTTPKAPKIAQQKQTLWAIFLAGLAGGFAALLMPCIFPMLPLTVSFFTKSDDKKGSPAGKAAVYGVSIIAIYVIMGLLVTVIFGADALNSLSTNGVFNFGFFLLIVTFAASFFGAFEITLPSGWVNKMDQNSDKGGLTGLFFMAATLALVSFSCTGPIIGTLLVQAATTGALLGPAIGMLGFALALAIPFVLFAMFPSWLQSLPKSGGWLNSVKVTLGFLELALSFKFLSNVDLAYHWHWFDREIFLVLWIVIFALMGFYLLGKLKFSHDSDLKFISVPRLFLAIIVLAFTMYMIPGLWGAPLKSISAFLPPQATQDFDLSNSGIGNNNQSSSNSTADTQPRKYAGLFDKPKGFNPYFDYDEGLAYAKRVHKPVMIDFTGHACVNCRKMEANVWPDKQVYQRITQDYVLIQLYVDDKTDLGKGEQTVTPEGRKIQTIGNKWSYLQTSKFVSNSQPFYVLLDPDTQDPLVTPEGADYDPVSYLKYLDSGLKVYHE